jgi:hypothetical protein
MENQIIKPFFLIKQTTEALLAVLILPLYVKQNI